MNVDVVLIWGTRPEHIKIYPVWKALKEKNLSVYTICTGQHTDLIDFRTFDIDVDVNLNVMKPNQSLSLILHKCLSSLDSILDEIKPKLVIVQGDTSSALSGALSAFYHEIDVAHIESGLNTFLKSDPFPEEIHRNLIREISDYHFAPTLFNVANLENVVDRSNIFFTGNTVVDSVTKICEDYDIPIKEVKENKVLVTIHRRENEEFFDEVCDVLKDFAKEHKDFHFIFPAHPRIIDRARENLDYMENISVRHSMNYIDFLREIATSYCIITDSGGVQEEASILGQKCFIIRNRTERMESVSSIAKLCGNRYDSIMKALEIDFNDDWCKEWHNENNIYGDGNSGVRIANIIENVIK